MDIHDFFDFYSKCTSSTVRAHPVGLDTGPQQNGIFDYLRLIGGGYDGIHFPVVFKQDHGAKLLDILNTGYVSLFLISDKIKGILEENNLTGWKAYPIKLLDKKENEISGYHGFSITGRCGPIDYNKSQIFQKRLVEGGPLCTFYKGKYVGLDQWDGSDFFQPKGNLGIIVTAKTAAILKKNKINVFLQNLADVEIYEGTVRLSEKKRHLN